ncbi:rhodanese-like domain-containing protein [Aequorivita echinoideorum]|uniref:Rhodanese-like domain-containing protein n=1 Tax=Aequorivita echinoideorum TaxID=1549647 RepID=A0ABS5S2J0_9FLAO|nr:rhodanese-like domain-containing protein [Aequorivita echinoideorum]MBT0607408.1 rhodanese-like domain-containing protein [Aequorivita echinoideorum]
MKNPIYIILFLFFILIGCKDKSQNAEIRKISPQEVYNAVYNTDDIQLIDVRTVDEYKDGHLGKAQNVCVTDSDFREKAALLDKNKPVYVYCKSGGRSAKAAIILKEMGFTEIYDIDGGYTNWKSQGLETEN